MFDVLTFWRFDVFSSSRLQSPDSRLYAAGYGQILVILNEVKDLIHSPDQLIHWSTALIRPSDGFAPTGNKAVNKMRFAGQCGVRSGRRRTYR